ncbi:LOW QUALITY PROTEIN: Hypothetical protein PHPALM_17334 [Phytophthora palmivora]|uniref:Jacalin-type lectin domain-containing protein n=1 Tax=Phytophthora palmivora TaxID=4796 RepID=A0A2P4XML9_9STRA|nr:LOW QUALITY PROTEIN: Hypothetical protein PHPALM_17334 [Phytophthora palmivora]
MRLLHLVSTISIAFLALSEITFATKNTMKSDSIHDTTQASDETASEERRGAVGGGGRELPTPAPLPPGVYLGKEFGGPHGYRFTDVDMVKSGQKVVSISIRSHGRVDAVSLDIVLPAGDKNTLYHGGNGGKMNTTALAEGEHITHIEANWGHTRYIKFTTNLGKVIEGGRRTDSVDVDKAKEGFQLGGFIGRSGDEVDMVGAIWTSIQPVE